MFTKKKGIFLMFGFNRKLNIFILITFFLVSFVFGQAYEFTDFVMTPGRSQSELNFNWYSKENTTSVVQVALKFFMKAGKFPYRFSKSFSSKSKPAVNGFYQNKVTVTGLELNTHYIYRLGDGKGKWTSPFNFSTYAYQKFSFLAMGDIQIGTRNVKQDTQAWNNTLNKAFNKFPKTAFILSVGDQVESAGNEDEFSGFFSPDLLKKLPLSPAIGNHDYYAKNSYYHFNLPNHPKNTGENNSHFGNYYFRYGSALFIVLNSNNMDILFCKKLINKAMKENEDADWKIVMFHHDIYGSAHHTLELPVRNIRAALVPVFDTHKVDIVLTGHDHSYTRTHVMFDDKPQLQQNYNDSGAVIDPNGTVYFTLNSSTGSKYYSLNSSKADYEAHRSQLKVPTFSNVTIDSNTLSLNTYRTDTMAQVDSFSVVKRNIQRLSKSSCFSFVHGLIPYCNRTRCLKSNITCDRGNKLYQLGFGKKIFSKFPISKFGNKNFCFKVLRRRFYKDTEYFDSYVNWGLNLKDLFSFEWDDSILGDVDNNGMISIVDALLIAKYYVGYSLKNFNFSLADTNGDNSVDVSDALLVALYTVGSIRNFSEVNVMEL